MRREANTASWLIAAAGLVCGVCVLTLSTGSANRHVELDETDSATDPSSPPPKVLDCGPDGSNCNLNNGGDMYLRKHKQQRLTQRFGARPINAQNPAVEEQARWMVNSLFGGSPAQRLRRGGAGLQNQMRGTPLLWGFDNNKYGQHKNPGKDSSDYENYQRSAGAEHHTISDIGTWWGDNNAWYDGWEAHRQDVNQAPRWWDKDFDGYKSYVRDLERDMPDTKWRNENIQLGKGNNGEEWGDGVAMNDDESYERERMARTFDDSFMYGSQWKDKPKIYYGMNEKPRDKYPGYTIQSTKHKGSKGKDDASTPPWCDWIIGCQPGIMPYDADGDLKWNTEPDDPNDRDSYITNWYRINQAR